MEKAVAEDKKLDGKNKEATGPDLLLLHPDVRLFVESEILPAVE